jgi:hypothetical protein
MGSDGYTLKSWQSLSRYSDGRPGFDPREWLEIFIFSKASRSGPTQSAIQWVPGALSPGVKRGGREADHSPPPSAEVKKGGAIP